MTLPAEIPAVDPPHPEKMGSWALMGHLSRSITLLNEAIFFTHMADKC